MKVLIEIAATLTIMAAIAGNLPKIIMQAHRAQINLLMESRSSLDSPQRKDGLN